MVGTDAHLPKVTIVTPSFNQGQYLEETIRSVLDQGYPNLEYMVIDGGSADNSVEIIRKYEGHLAYWVSEKDRGQTHAINKGMARATGDILAYINSDDYYLPGALERVAKYATEHAETDLIHGRCRYVDEHGAKIGEQFASISEYRQIVDLWDVWWARRQFVQPEVFWTRRIAEKIGPLRDELQWVMDYEYWARMLRNGARVGRIDAELACFRFQPQQKTNFPQQRAEEQLRVVQPLLFEHAGPLPRLTKWRLQGKWLYDVVFRREAARSLEAGQSRARRWARLARLSLSHPQMLATRRYWARAGSALLRREGRS
jgi:glycosyltransferase involved in cell wall biosynthesis